MASEFVRRQDALASTTTLENPRAVVTVDGDNSSKHRSVHVHASTGAQLVAFQNDRHCHRHRHHCRMQKETNDWDTVARVETTGVSQEVGVDLVVLRDSDFGTYLQDPARKSKVVVQAALGSRDRGRKRRRHIEDLVRKRARA